MIIIKKRLQNASPQAIVNGTSVKIKASIARRRKGSRRSHCCEEKNSIIMISHPSGVKVSSKYCKYRMRSKITNTFNKLLSGCGLIILIILSVLVVDRFCHCDNVGNNYIPKQPVGDQQAQDHHQSKMMIPRHKIALTTRQPKSSSHKEHLLASLSESIERQHFMKPIKALVQSRPSKFDENLEPKYTDSTGQLAATMTKSNTNNNKEKPTSHKDQSIKTVPPGQQRAHDKMRDIMMMHDHGGHHHNYPQHNTNNNKLVPIEKDRSGRKKPITSKDHHEESQKSSTRWFDSVLQPSDPVKQLNNLIKPIRVVSYLAPLVSNRSLFESLIGVHSSKFTDDQSKGKLQIRNPFIARANNQMSLRYKTKKMPPTGAFAAESHKPPYSSTDMPQSTVLSRPYDTGPDWQSISSTPMTALLNEPLNDLMADASSISTESSESAAKNVPSLRSKSNPLTGGSLESGSPVRKWIKNGANQMAQGYFQDSFRDLLTLSQLPILSGGPVSTAPSELEPGGKKWLANKVSTQQAIGNRSQTIDDILRYLYLFGTGVRRKRDPLKILGPSKTLNLVAQRPRPGFFSQRSNQPKTTLRPKIIDYFQEGNNRLELIQLKNRLNSLLPSNRNARPRGVMWDMATDPSLAVTVFHLLERASVALPLGFLLMPFVRMIRNPMNGFNMGRILPPRAAHRSVDYEELAKRLDMIDKVFSRALRQTHREASFTVLKR